MMKRYMLTCVMLIVNGSTLLVGRSIFDSLSAIEAYAKTLPEAVANESLDEFKPTFNQFNTAHAVGFGTRLLSLFGFKQHIDSKDFISSMKRVINSRELDGNYGEFVCKAYITDNTNWFMWGSLYGAFHSFVRSLHYLKESAVIDDALRITQADTYFVFTDNMQSYTPYGLETFWLMLALLEQNPGKIVVLKTMDAQTDVALKHVMLNEFSVRFAQPVQELEVLLQKFSNTLALALYLVSKDNAVVRICALQDTSKLNDTRWTYFFQDPVKGCFKIKDIELSDERVSFASSIHLHHTPTVGQKISRLYHAQHGATHVWKLFSTPVEPFKSIFRFHYDSFVELVTEKYFSNWQLLVWSHDADKALGFQKVRSFNVESGRIAFSINPQERIDFLEQQIALQQEQTKQIEQQCVHAKSGDEQTDQTKI